MSHLAAILKRQIQRLGPMTLADYMAACLYHPTLGYYRRHDPLGRSGDFVTAPEISPLYGALMGTALEELWRQSGSPRHCHVVELGPGRGTLMRDLLTAAPALRAHSQIHLVEINSVLRTAQAETLASLDLTAAPQWHDSALSLPSDAPLLIVANEYFDALPIHQFVRTDEAWREAGVGLDDRGDRLVRVLLPVSSAFHLAQTHIDLHPAPVGSVAEICPAALSTVKILAQHVVTQGGALLIADYGSSESAVTTSGSFQAVKDHAYADPLAAPGNADLTAHVDFAGLATIARQHGARCFGPASQGNWLKAMGIERLYADIAPALSPGQQMAVQAGIHRLCDEDQMGKLFKIMIITHPDIQNAPGMETLPL